MAATTAHTQYAVKVGNRGWATVWGQTISADEPDQRSGGLHDSRKAAEEAAADLARRYVELGAPDIADSIEIYQRTQTLSYSDWASVTATEKASQPVNDEAPF